MSKGGVLLGDFLFTVITLSRTCFLIFIVIITIEELFAHTPTFILLSSSFVHNDMQFNFFISFTF